MTLPEATARYEAWLARHLRVLPADLAAKHAHMAADPFSFFRATFYRWMQLFPGHCPDLMRAPAVLAVGDLHVENYGTWRDAEGRLIWGVNDFDEAYPLPYALDLVRLATSACLAIRQNHLTLPAADASAAILEGYRKGIEKGGQPYVLSEDHAWLREAVTSHLRDPALFWEKLESLPTARTVPAPIRALLLRALPGDCTGLRIVHRQAGLGSLGRERYTALAQWRGGNIAREAKALLPSAAAWAAGRAERNIYYTRLITAAVRTPDPFLAVRSGWVIRRLAPYCSRIELAQLPRSHDKLKMLRAMGHELANLHTGTPRALPALRRHLKHRPADWLHRAATAMTAATLADWQTWVTR